MSTTASGIPRVKLPRKIRTKRFEDPAVRPEPKKKGKGKTDIDDPDDPLNAWRKK